MKYLKMCRALFFMAVLNQSGLVNGQERNAPSQLPLGFGPETRKFILDRKPDWQSWEERQDKSQQAKYLAALSRLTASPDAAKQAEGLRWLQELAQAGMPSAQFAMREIYRHGKFNVTADQQSSRLWLRAAAEKGLPLAQWELATEFREAGETVDCQIWMFRAAMNGHLPARKIMIALIYQTDIPWEEIETDVLRWASEIADADKNDVQAAYVTAMLLHFRALDADQPLRADAIKAIHYYRQAADRKLARAQFRLSQAYLDGFGVKPDAKEAVRWLTMAAESNHPEAMATLAEVCAVGAFGQSKDTAAAEKWITRAEQSKEPAALFIAARFRENHTTNLEKAENLYRLAANDGHKEAQLELARLLTTRMIKESEAVSRRKHEATFILQRLQMANHYPAYVMAAKLAGEAGNWKDAVRLLRVAAHEGNLLSGQYHLALCYLKGHGGRKDEIEAVRWLKSAASHPTTKGCELEWAAACFELARCYENGTGVFRNREEAMRIYETLAGLSASVRKVAV